MKNCIQKFQYCTVILLFFCLFLQYNNIKVFADTDLWYEEYENNRQISDDGNWAYLFNEDGTVYITDYLGDMQSNYIFINYEDEHYPDETCYSLYVPSNIDGYTVKRIRLLHNTGGRNVNEIVLEDGIKEIGMINNYHGNDILFIKPLYIKKVIIPNSVEKIYDSLTLANMTNAIIITNPDSYARQYAEENNYKWQCIEHKNIITTSTAVDPTYESDGRTEEKKCEDCGAIVEESQVIPKLIKEETTTQSKQINQQIITQSDNVYKISDKTNTVEITKIKKLKKNVIIPSTIVINGKKYKVTSIAKNVFKGNKKLKKLILGKNITTISSNAFKGCKNLKTIVIKSKNIKTVGKNAFKGINKNAKIKVPASKYKKYLKLIKGKNGKKKGKYKVIKLK